MRIGMLFTSHLGAPHRDSQNKEKQELMECVGGICLINPKTPQRSLCPV